MDLKESKLITNTAIVRHPWELAKLEVIYNLIKYYVPDLLKSKGIVLDVGCGDIFVVKQLAMRMPCITSFVAIDTAFDDNILKAYRDKLEGSKIQVFESLEKATQHITGEISLVILLDVIEHIDDDIAFLQWLKTNPAITDNTIFLITAPAFQFLFCSHDTFYEHYRRYNNKSLKDCMCKAGLRVMHIGYFFFTLLPPRLLHALFEKIINPKSNTGRGAGDWKGNRFCDSILKAILIIDFKISFFLRKMCSIKLFGISNYVICADIRTSRPEKSRFV